MKNLFLSTLLITTFYQSCIAKDEPLTSNISDEIVTRSNESQINKKRQRNKFTPEEDEELINLVKINGPDWKSISSTMQNRNPRQCRDRWNNYLNPNENENRWTREDDCLLLSLHSRYGNNFKVISKYFSHRSQINIKNRFSCLARKKNTAKKGQLQHKSSILARQLTAMNQTNAPALLIQHNANFQLGQTTTENGSDNQKYELPNITDHSFDSKQNQDSTINSWAFTLNLYPPIDPQDISENTSNEEEDCTESLIEYLCLSCH